MENSDDGHHCDEDIGEDKAKDNVRKRTSEQNIDGAIKVATKVVVVISKILDILVSNVENTAFSCV